MARRIPTHLPAVLVLGLVGQVGQVLLLRELLMVFHGNEFSMGLILAAWMAWVSVGSRLGAIVAERNGRPLALLSLNAMAVAVVLPATILLIRTLRGFFRVLPGAYLSLSDIALSSFLVLAPVCLLLGAQFVLLSRAWRDSDQTRDMGAAGKTYAGEAAGNMIGGLLFTLLMVRHLNSLQSALLVAMLMLVANLVAPGAAALHRQATSARLRWMALGIFPVILLAFGLAQRLDNWASNVQWRQLVPQHRLVETYQSKHGTISVLQRHDQYSFFQSGHLVFSTAGPKAASPGFEEQEAANLAHLALVQHRQPEQVLLIGGGLRGTLSEVAKHPVERIDYIELDPVLTRAARPYVSHSTRAALSDPQVHLVHTDGRLFVKTTSETYDLILVDLPDPTTAVLNRYYTAEFFVEARAILNPSGVLIISATSTPELQDIAVANRNAMLYHTLNSVFAHVLVAGDHYLVYVASNAAGQISMDVSVLEQRFQERGIESDSFSHHHYQMLLYESLLRRANWVVRVHGRSQAAHLQGPGPIPLALGAIVEQQYAEETLPPVVERYFINSDLRPIGYSYTLMLWEHWTRAGQSASFRWLLHVEPWWVLPWVVLPLAATATLGRWGGARRRSDLGFGILLAVFTTGLSIMALQIALLLSFQTVYGFVYEMVGLIMALFMGGLALGTLLARKFLLHRATVPTLATMQLLIALFAVLIALILDRAVTLPSPTAVLFLFSALTFASGMVNGVGFPISAACYLALRGNADRAVGAVYGVELLGACLGAILASVVIAPILGLVACCLFAAVGNATAFLALMICRRSHA